jgi:hypothetical protein
MANLGHTFDATTVEPIDTYEVLPVGKYLAQIVNSEMRVTKDGSGQYLFLEIDVLDGRYVGRKLFDRIHLVNPNPEAVQIAQRTLSSICRAVGKLQVSDSSQLHLTPFIADVRVRPPKGQYGESNSMRYLSRAQGGSAQAARTSHVASQAPQQSFHAPVSTVPAVAPVQAANGLPWQRQA